MTLTADSWALERVEVVTTAVAVTISTALYVRSGHAYLARGVVGDIAGLALLTGVLAGRRRRVRHEALVCLAAIGVVLALDPQWPLLGSSTFWWLAVTGVLTGYLAVRHRILSEVAR